ncbi:MAG: serine hydrolase [Candidatus Promineifilaceae bacterium]
MHLRFGYLLSLLALLLAACTQTAVSDAAAPTATASAPQPALTATTEPAPLPTGTPLPTATALPSNSDSPPDLRYLQAAIEETLADFDGISSYVVIDLTSGERIARNENVAIAGMSLVKVPILIETYRTLDLPLTAEQTKLITETTALSSNYAANLLLQLIAGKPDTYAGADIVSQAMRDLGLFNTFIAVPIDAEPKEDRLNTVLTPANQRTDITTYADPFRQITTGDLAALLQMIYACAETDSGPLREVYGSSLTADECRDLLDKMQLNELAKLLETGLPAGTLFAHKVGWIDDTHGDGGIVFSPGGDYVVVMALYGKGWLEWEQSAPLFEAVARQTFAHFNEPGVYEGVVLPPLPTQAPLTPTPDLPHAVVSNTQGVGLTVRQTPGGGELAIVPEGTILTLLPEARVSADGYEWQQVRLPDGREGWAATSFFTEWTAADQ